MITTTCQCGGELAVGEDLVNTLYRCPACGRDIRMVCAEQLAEGAGAGDFDARLTVAGGPARVGECIFLGGVADIEIGKLAGKHIQLEAQLVSRFHCKLVRLDFGPSRWKIVDNKSTNGLFVNQQRIAEQELQIGDEVNIGGYRLEYALATPAVEEEPIDLGDAIDEPEELEEEPIEAVVAAPTKVAKKPKPIPRALAYARDGGLRYLGDSDRIWVQKLKLASNLLLLAIVLNIFSFLCSVFVNQMVGLLLGVAATLVNVLGAWFLTEREPDVEETSGHGLLRLSLRIVSTIAAGGAICAAAAQLLENPALMFGGLAALAAIPQFFLFLLFLRILAKRIPNDSLATNCLIVMIGLPASIAVVMGGAIYMGMGHPLSGGMWGICSGVCSALIFWIWYLILLIWFNRSFS